MFHSPFMPLESKNNSNNSKKKKTCWSKIVEFFKKDAKEECDHLYFPHDDGKWVIGQKCCICDKFNSCEQLGMKPFKLSGYKGYDDTRSF